MRTIRFRGLSKETNKFVYGDLIRSLEYGTKIMSTIHDGGNAFDVEPHDYQVSYNIFPESVGQFTGLQDKNGVDIYEGDILFNDKLRKSSFQVKYNLCGFDAVYDGNFTLNLYQVLTHEKGGCEIIGNIHETK